MTELVRPIKTAHERICFCFMSPSSSGEKTTKLLFVFVSTDRMDENVTKINAPTKNDIDKSTDKKNKQTDRRKSICKHFSWHFNSKTVFLKPEIHSRQYGIHSVACEVVIIHLANT